MALASTCCAGCGQASIDDQTLTVLVQDAETTRPSVDFAVVVHDAMGAVLQTTRTDAEGKALLVVPRGGMVSTFQTVGPWGLWDSVVDPPAGSTLHFMKYAEQKPSPQPTLLQVVPTDMPAGSSTLRYMGSCANWPIEVPATQSPISLPNCGTDKLDMIVIAQNEEGQPLGWGAILDLPAVPGQTIERTVSLAKRGFVKSPMQLLGIPAGMSSSVSLHPRGALGTRQPFLQLAAASSSVAATGQFRAELSMPTDLMLDGVNRRAGYFSYHDDEAYWSSDFVTRIETTRDVSVPLSYSLPSISSPKLHRPDLSDPQHPVLTWDGSRFGDAVIAWLSYKGQSGLDVLWEVHAAPDSAQVLRVPDVPSDQAALAPQAGKGISLAELRYVDADDVQGFAEHLARQPEASVGTSLIADAMMSVKTE